MQKHLQLYFYIHLGAKKCYKDMYQGTNVEEI